MWQINLRLAVRLRSRLVHVSNHTDHRRPLSLAAVDAFAERALARPVGARQRYVHDRDARRVPRVRHREIAAGNERNAERMEVPGHRDAVFGMRLRIVRAVRLTVYVEGATPAIRPHWHRIAGADFRYTGKRRGRRDNLSVEVDHLGGTVVLRAWKRELHRRHIGRNEPGFHVL